MVYAVVLQSPTEHSINRFENKMPRRMRLMARVSSKALPSLGAGGGRFHRSAASISLSRLLHRISPFADGGARGQRGALCFGHVGARVYGRASIGGCSMQAGTTVLLVYTPELEDTGGT